MKWRSALTCGTFFFASLPMAGEVSAGALETNLKVEAHILPSARIEWDQLDTEDPRYRKAVLALRKALGKQTEQDRFTLLPNALLVTLATNDPQRMISFHVDDLAARGGPGTYRPSKLYVSMDGQTPHRMHQDLPLLTPDEKKRSKELVLLMGVYPNSGYWSGKYNVNFRFISTTVP